MVHSPPVLGACLGLALATIPASAKPPRMASTDDAHRRLDIIQESDAFQIVLRAAAQAFTAPGGGMAVGSSIRIDARIARALAQHGGDKQ